MGRERERQRYLEDIPYIFSITHDVSDHGLCGVFHIHYVFELLLILSDGVQIDLDEERYSVPRDTVIMYSHTDLHRAIARRNHTYDRYILYFCPEEIDIFSSEQTHLLECFYHRPSHASPILPLTPEQKTVLLPLFEALNRVYNQPQPLPGDTLLERTLVCQILIYLNRYYRAYNNLPEMTAGADTRVIYKVLTYIAEHYTEKLTLSDLAQQVFLSNHYLCRRFKQVVGISPMDYVANLRMTKAKELLIQGISVEETCARVGYGNLSHFSRQFHQKTGMSPRQYASGRGARGTMGTAGSLPPRPHQGAEVSAPSGL